MKDDESRAGYKQRMLKKRLEQAEAEVVLLRRSVASYRTYQEHELDEARLADDKDVIEEHSGVEGAKADAKQFRNPLLRDDPLLSDEEEEGDGKEDDDAARKK